MLFFPGFAAPESLSKAAGAEPFGGMRPKSARDCRSQNATKHFSIGTLLEVALLKNAHAAVAPSMFPSQNAENTAERFWKLRCSNSARSCGAKHISK